MMQQGDKNQTASGLLPPFHFSIDSGELAVRDALARFLNALNPLQLDVEETGSIELVLAEVLNNIVEHAYPDHDVGGEIKISCAQQADGLIVQIKDRGRMMPDGKLPIGMLESIDVDLDDMPEGGFGWFLIQHLARDVEYSRVGDENHLNLRLAIGIQ